MKSETDKAEDIIHGIVLGVICLIIIGVSISQVDPKFRLPSIQILILLLSAGGATTIALSFLNACWKMVKALNKINSNLEEINRQNSLKP